MNLAIYNNFRDEENVIERCVGSLRLRRSLSSIIVAENLTLIDMNNQTNDTFMEYDDESSGCSSVYALLEYLHDYYVPFMIFAGLIGNLLSSIVFLHTHLKMRSSSYYLAALATTDAAYLLTLLCVWLNRQYGWHIFNGHGWCQLLLYISAVCSSLSVWLIVAFTVERFIAVQYPLHRPQICTVSRAKKIVITLTVSALTFHSYAFIVSDLIKNRTNEYLCGLKQQYFHFMEIINIIDTISSLVLPLIVIVVMNTMISYNLMKFGRRFQHGPSTVTVISNQCPRRDHSEINLNRFQSSRTTNYGIPLKLRQMHSKPSTKPSKISQSPRSSMETAGMRKAITSVSIAQSAMPIASRCIHVRASFRDLVSMRNQHSITKMLLLTSTVYVLLNLPSYAIRLWAYMLTAPKESPRKDRLAAAWCLQQFSMLLYYTSFSINTLLYAMNGITFRRCLIQLLQKHFRTITKCFGRRRRVSENS